MYTTTEIYARPPGKNTLTSKLLQNSQLIDEKRITLQRKRKWGWPAIDLCIHACTVDFPQWTENWRLWLSLKCPLSECVQAAEAERTSQSKKLYIPNNTRRSIDRADSGNDVKSHICNPWWNGKLGGSHSCWSARYLNTFRLLKQKKLFSQRSPMFLITPDNQLTGQLGCLSNWRISTISKQRI